VRLTAISLPVTGRQRLLLLYAIAVVFIAASVIQGPASVRLTQRTAKIRTFKALLRVTEEAPDVADATHAAITVGSCRKSGNAYICKGSLAPVAFSGIPGLTCPYTVVVYPITTKVKDGDCI
jgi:hypothetical protein